jgi:sarcosine oxidase
MADPQIVVVGLGATGSAALWHLARRGVRTIGIERFEIGHDRGSSHGPTRIFRLAHFENASYVPLLRHAAKLWRELEENARQKLVSLCGIVEIGPSDGELVRGTVAAAQRHSLPHEVLDSKTFMGRFPDFILPDNFVAVLQPNGGIIDARSAIEAYIHCAAEAGAKIRTGEKVLSIEPSDKAVRIITDRIEIEAAGAIIAAGPWTNSLLPKLNLPLRVTRQVVGWFEPDDAAQFAPDRFPVFLLETRHGIHYGFPAYGNMGVKVARHHHLDETVEADTYDRNVTAQDEAVIRAPLAQYLPGADGRLLAAQTCLYTMTPDDTFIIDCVPGFPHTIVASPCCGHGFKFSPVVGEILADLATRGTTASDISQFCLRRFASQAPA